MIAAFETLFSGAVWLGGVTGLVLGAVVGSFVATVLIRWPQGRRATVGRSRCDSCQARLTGRDLVPILSYLFTAGRCRRCNGRIDGRHVAIEIAAAMLGLFALVAHPGMDGIVTAVLGWWLLLIAALDLDHHWLPDRLTLPLIAAGLVAAWFGFGPELADRAVGAVTGFLILWMIAGIYRHLRGREGLGGGDPKLLAALGAWLGWQQLPLVLLGAGLVGLTALLIKALRGGHVAAADRLPLGTLMALAAWPIWLLIAA